MPASEIPRLFRTAFSDHRVKMFDEIDNHKITRSGRHSTQNKRERKYYTQKMNKNYSCLAPSNELCEFWRSCQPTKTRWHAAPNDQNAQPTTDARANKNDKNRFTHAPA